MTDEPLSAAVSRALRLRVRVVVAEEPASRARLSRGEAARLETLGPPRREAWLRGRAALKHLLDLLGEDTDTTPVAFPHPRLSLTHSGALAVAVATECSGTGVDFEICRALRTDTGRFFLTSDEHEGLAAADGDLLRLWTVKEAVFKADVENGRHGLADYRVDDLAAASGTAVRRDEAMAFRYGSLEWRGGVLTVAIRSES